MVGPMALAFALTPSPSCVVLPVTFLPVLNRAPIVLQGDQAVHGTNTRIESVVMRPVVDGTDMADMMVRLRVASVLGVLAKSRRAPQTQRDERAQNKAEGGNICSHVRSPVEAVRQSAKGHAGAAILPTDAPRLVREWGVASSEVLPFWASIFKRRSARTPKGTRIVHDQIWNDHASAIRIPRQGEEAQLSLCNRSQVW